MFMFHQQSREQLAPYVYFDRLFSVPECEAIQKLAEGREPIVANVGDGISEKTLVNPELRRTQVWWIKWDQSNDWIFKKLASCVEQANLRYNFNINGFQEALQLACYPAEMQAHYNWHSDHDFNEGFANRKLSVSVALNDQWALASADTMTKVDGFQGGDFEFFNAGKVSSLETSGSTIVFPSFKVHRVRPVTAGKRWSLVAWVAGPVFR